MSHTCSYCFWQPFEQAMYKRFSMIDVVKSLKMTKKKDKSERLKLNELKLITAPEDIYRLWSDVITNATHGELYNPDTNLKFNARPDWNLESCMLMHEFFKFLGNLRAGEVGKVHPQHPICQAQAPIPEGDH